MLDETNPRSLINTCPERLVPIIKATAKRFPKLIYAPERQVRQTLKPDERDEKLRLSFWEEYNAATAHGRRMSLTNILRGVVFTEIWNNYYEKRLDKIAFILSMPRNYSLALRNILDKGVDRLLEIIQLPIMKDDGTPNIQAITQVLKAFQLVDMRVKGAVVQRVQIQQQSLNFNTDVTTEFAKEQAKQLSALSLEDLELLERKIQKVERIEGQVLSTLPPEERQKLDELRGAVPAPERYPLKEVNPPDAMPSFDTYDV